MLYVTHFNTHATRKTQQALVTAFERPHARKNTNLTCEFSTSSVGPRRMVSLAP